jgi:hypothetical protein
MPKNTIAIPDDLLEEAIQELHHYHDLLSSPIVEVEIEDLAEVQALINRLKGLVGDVEEESEVDPFL